MPSRSIFLPAFERGLAAPFAIGPGPTAEAEAPALLPRLLSPPTDEEFFATQRVIQRLIPDLTPETVLALLRGLRLISRKKADKAAICAVLAFLQGGGVGQFPALDPARQETRLSLTLALERFGRFHEVLRIVGQLAIAIGNLGDGPAKLQGWRSCYFLNYRELREQRGLMSAWRGAHLPAYGLSYARSVLPYSKAADERWRVAWHFTNVADPGGLADKMRASSHEEYARLGADHYAPLLARIRAGERDPDWERIPVEALPPYVAEHRERFADLLI